MIDMIVTIRTTNGRENSVIDNIMARMKKEGAPVKSVIHPAELHGYIFIEGEINAIEETIKGLPHVRGIINKPVELSSLENFLVSEKAEINIEIGDVVEVVGGPSFKGEKGKVTRLDKTKNEITIEFLEAPIPIPVTLPMSVVRIYQKKR